MKNSKINYVGITNINDALVLSGNDFIAKKTHLISNNITHSDMNGITTDNGLFLGIAGKNYNIIQNNDIFDVINPLLQNKAVSIESINLHKSKVFLKLVSSDTFINGDKSDKLKNYIYLTNDFSGKASNKIQFFSIRLVCTNGMVANTLNASYSIKHFTNFEEKIKFAFDMLHNNEVYQETFLNGIEKMSQVKMTTDTFMEYIYKILNVDKNKLSELSTKKQNEINDIISLHNSKEDIKKYKNTIFGGYLAITDFFSNIKSVRNEGIAFVKEASLIENSNLDNAYSYGYALSMRN
jgi:hypothetical protein